MVTIKFEISITSTANLIVQKYKKKITSYSTKKSCIYNIFYQLF